MRAIRFEGCALNLKNRESRTPVAAQSASGQGGRRGEWNCEWRERSRPELGHRVCGEEGALHWLSGRVEKWAKLSIDRHLTLPEESGTPVR